MIEYFLAILKNCWDQFIIKFMQLIIFISANSLNFQFAEMILQTDKLTILNKADRIRLELQ